MGKYAILIVSALIFSMLTYSSALRNALFQSEFRNIESFSQLQALNIANSAALLAINDIQNDSDSDFAPDAGESYSYPSSTGFASWDTLAGSYNLQVANQADTLLVIRSTGRFGEDTDITDYRVTVGLTAGTSDWLALSVDKAIHAENSVSLGNGKVTGDISFNATFSEFGSQSNAAVVGDLYFVDENMAQMEYEELSSDAVENIYLEREPFEHPLPIFPTYNVENTTTEYNVRSGSESWANSTRTYDSFNANNTTINTGSEGQETKIYVNDLDLSKDLILEGDGRVSFYVDESLDLGNGQVNEFGNAKNLTVYYRGHTDIKNDPNDILASGNGSFRGLLFNGSPDVTIDIQGKYMFNGNIISYSQEEVNLGGNPDISSLIFAPSAKVTINGTGTGENAFRGAIVSESFVNNGGASIIYDEEFSKSLPQLDQKDDSKHAILYWN